MGMTPEEKAWLEALPRVTLAQRVYYYAWRDELQRERPVRPRPYIFWRKPEPVGWFDEGSTCARGPDVV